MALGEAKNCVNRLHAAMRYRVEQANARFKMTFAALRHLSRSPWRITQIAGAVRVMLHPEHHRTT